MTRMTTEEFVAHLRDLDIRVWIDGDRLGFDAAKGTMTSELRAEMGERKPHIIDYLRATSYSTPATPPPIRPSERTGRLPLSFAQQRLWFLDKLEPGSYTYNVSPRFRLRGPVDVGVLERSLNEVMRRHEVLRTSFVDTDDGPVQEIGEPAIAAIPVIDLRGCAESEHAERTEQLSVEERTRPFDLERGPLIRATLLRHGDEDHTLLLTVHHAVADGWSLGVLAREIGALYDAFLAGEPSPLPPLPIQYADYAVWQREWLQGNVLADQLAYWRRQLDGDAAPMQLPTDRPRPTVQTFRGANAEFVLPEALSASLNASSRREGATLFMTTLAAFMVLLHKYTGRDDISVGTPIANRHRIETEPLIGFFVNTLVMRADLGGNPTFRELLGRVREVALGAYAHQDLPFEKLVEELQPERDLSYSPLFQVLFALQNAPMQPLRLRGLAPSPLEYPGGTAKFDLTLFVEETHKGLTATFEYNVDLFDASTIARMAGHYQRLLESIAAHPERRLSELAILTSDERHQLLVEWNATGAEYPSDMLVHQLFEVQADRTPDAIAVEFGNMKLTYRELDRRANMLAHYLRQAGVEPGQFVGICMHRSLEMVVAVLGTLKAGGAYVALDPSYPNDRLAYMMDDSNVRVLLTQERSRASLPSSNAAVVFLDAEWETIARESSENPRTAATPESTVYVTYTSGSTGRPKGICMVHRAIVNLVSWMCRTTHLPERARTLQFASLSFDVSAQDMFSTWHSGGTLVLITEAQRRDLMGLATLLDEKQIHRLFIPAVALQQLAEGFCARRPCAPPLRKVIAGSEQLIVTDAIAQMFSGLDACSLHNEYGPSEAHVVTAYALQGPPEVWPKRVPIGRPISNARIYLLDRYMEPVPIGVSGELYIAGDCLAAGYLHLPDKTAERFVPDPFDDRPDARLYRTGDLARYLPDGTIEFLGRIDHQMKIRGYRIEPGEIETVLAEHPAVTEAIVMPWQVAPGDTRLLAYIATGSASVPTVSALRAFLLERLPEYMVPSTFVLLAAFPLTANGKVDRRALPKPESERPELESTYVAPQSDIERAIVRIWQDALRLENMGVTDNFFDLGGHSLLVVQVQRKLHAELEREVSIVDLFRYPTISALARYLGEVSRHPAGIGAAHDRARRQREALARQNRLAKGKRTNE